MFSFMRSLLRRMQPRPAPLGESTPAPPDAFADQARLLAAAGITPTVIVDGGAYVGELTACYLKAFPAAHVYAVEPGPANVARLEARFRDNPRVTVVPAALAERAGERILSLNDADMTHSLLPIDPASPYFDYPVRAISTVRVAAADLDGFCRARGIERISILKLDIQGAEAEVLAGAATLLREARIDILFTELCVVPTYTGQTPLWTVLEMLAGYGYHLFDLYNVRRAPTGQLKWGDGLFLSPTLRATLNI